jgi:hypothetical protein
LRAALGACRIIRSARGPVGTLLGRALGETERFGAALGPDGADSPGDRSLGAVGGGLLKFCWILLVIARGAEGGADESKNDLAVRWEDASNCCAIGGPGGSSILLDGSVTGICWKTGCLLISGTSLG